MSVRILSGISCCGRRPVLLALFVLSTFGAGSVAADSDAADRSDANDLAEMRRVTKTLRPLTLQFLSPDEFVRQSTVRGLLEAWERQRPPGLSALPEDPEVRAVWAYLMCLSDDPNMAICVAPLLDDRAPKSFEVYYAEETEPLRFPLSLWVRGCLAYRAGLGTDGIETETAESLAALLEKLCGQGRPAQWAFRFRKAALLRTDTKPIEAALDRLPAAERGIAAAWVGAAVPGAFPNHRVRKTVATTLGVRGIRRTLNEPGEDLSALLAIAPKADVRRFRSFLIGSLPDIVTREDIGWLKECAVDKQGRLDWRVFHVLRKAFGKECGSWLISRYEAELDLLSRTMKFLPTGLHDLSGYADSDVLNAQALLGLAEHVDCLTAEYIKKADARMLGVIAFAAGMSDDFATALPILLDLVTNKAKTIPQKRMYAVPSLPPYPEEQTVRDAVKRVLRNRGLGLGVRDVEDAALLRQYGDFVKLPEGRAREWRFRFRKERIKGGIVGDVKERLQDEPQPTKGLAVVAIAAYRPSAYSDAAITEAVKGMDGKVLRSLVAGKWFWDGASRYMNAPPWSGMTNTIVERALPAFTVEDAEWLRQPRAKPGCIRLDYLIAAAKLDPARGAGWLRASVGTGRGSFDSSDRARLLAALWAVGGEPEVAYIVDCYFAELEYRGGGLQEGLIRDVAKNPGRNAAPLLKALILDRRFLTLSWAATRAFAENAAIVLGEETREVKRYLDVQHRMGRYDFERWPERREKYLVDTKHVLMQTEAFQMYLQGEVLKRSQTSDEQE